MTEEQKRSKLKENIAEIRRQIRPVGPMHSSWDWVFDMEAFLDGRDTILKKSLDEWLEKSEELIKPGRS